VRHRQAASEMAKRKTAWTSVQNVVRQIRIVRHAGDDSGFARDKEMER
jgi:hypothetical protein